MTENNRMKNPANIIALATLLSILLPTKANAENYVQYWKNDYGITQYVDMDSIRLVEKGGSLLYVTEVGSYPYLKEDGAAYYVSKNIIDCRRQYDDEIYWGTFTSDKIPLRVKEKRTLNEGIEEALSQLNGGGYEGYLSAGEMGRLCGILSRWTYEHANDSSIHPLIDKNNTITATSIPITKDGGVYNVKATINNEIPLTFVVDSGATDVVLPQYVGKTLFASGALTKADVLGTAQYALADGAIQSGIVVNLKSITIGQIKIQNVRASILPTDSGALLLGQSALRKLGKWRINSVKNALEIDKD